MAVLISTTDDMPGHRIVGYKGLVWASTAQSGHIGHDIMAMGKSLVGGEIGQYKKILNNGRNEAIQGIAKNAEGIGANAVVGVRFGSTQITPGTMDVYAYGTAVIIEAEHAAHGHSSHASHSGAHHASGKRHSKRK